MQLTRIRARSAAVAGLLVIGVSGISVTALADTTPPAGDATPSADSSPGVSPAASPATPPPVQVTTHPQPRTGVAGKTLLKDLATLRGATAGQLVRFQLWGPGAPQCTGTPDFSATSTALTPDQAAGTAPVLSDGFVARHAGAFQWTVQVLDGATVVGASGCGREPVNVAKAVPHIETRSVFEVVQGTPVSDHATLTRLVSPTGKGTVTFRLYGPLDTSCKQRPFYTSAPLQLDAAGGATSATVTPPAGNYEWRAFYSGDANNAPVASSCGNEKFEVRTTLTGIVADPASLSTPETGVALLEGRTGGVLLIGGLTVLLGALRRRDVQPVPCAAHAVADPGWHAVPGALDRRACGGGRPPGDHVQPGQPSGGGA